MFVIPDKDDVFSFEALQKTQIIDVITKLLRIKTCKIDTIG